MKVKIHVFAGILGFLTIVIFWTSTIYSEIFGSYETISAVKSMILKGMFILVPAMVIVGSSGMSLGGKRTDANAVAKKKRMPFIAANGLVILLPAAFYLETKASSGVFDASFYLVQVLEVISGTTNIVLMGLNIRDGLRMTGRIGRQVTRADRLLMGSHIEERDGGPLVVKGLTRLTDQDGKALELKPVIALCRCGLSETKPYCDGSHSKIVFDSHCSDAHTPDRLQTYEGKDIRVHYNRLLCSHAGECVKHLKSVFDLSRKPWIIPDNGPRSKIISVVKACPSGALSYSLAGQKPRHETSGEIGIRIEKDGPYRVVGIPLVSPRLAEGACLEKLVLCRCGASKNKPYCDGSHHDIKWRDDKQD